MPQWQGYNTVALPHTVTFDANGGSGTRAGEEASTTTILNVNSFTREGHHFARWDSEPDGSGDAYTDGADYDFTADLVLYAQWNINTYEVTSDTGDGSVIASLTLNHGVTAPAPAEDPMREGDSFTGWYPDLDLATEELTLDAGWEKIPAPGEADPVPTAPTRRRCLSPKPPCPPRARHPPNS